MSANTVSAAFPEIWSAKMQVTLQKSLVALKVCNTELKKELKVGDVIHRPYVSDMTAVAYQPGTAVTAQLFTVTDDSITADTKKIVPFYVDDVNELLAKPDYAAAVAEDAAYRLRDDIDSAALALVTAAATDFGATGVATAGFATGGTTAVTLSTANVVNFFSEARKGLRALNVEEAGDWIAIVRPSVAQVIEEQAVNVGFNLADATLRNGYAGNFMGFKIYVSNNMPANHAYIGRAGCIDLIMQAEPKMVIKDVDDQLGKNFLPYTVYGVGVLTKNSYRFLDANVTS